MYRLSFKLVQHTPIIHFQADYQGATLRASEVKPKLDKFLLKCFKRDKISIPNNWLIPHQKDALDYKLSFSLAKKVEIIKYFPLSNIGKNDRGILQEYIDSGRPLEGSEVDRRLLESKILSPTPFFANAEYAASRVKYEEDINDKKKKKKKKKREREREREREKKLVKGDVRIALLAKPKTVGSPGIEGLFLCKEEGLRKEIHKYLDSFFLLNNFGMRQTKGFGSFTLHSVDDKIIGLSHKQIASRMSNNGIKSYLQNDPSVCHILQTIARFHNKIKTGLDSKPSELRKFFDMGKSKKKMEWEKPLVRRYIGLSEGKGTKPYGKYYLRALLGLHGQFEFPKLDTRVRVSHDEIKRFASPITYKPIDDIIYLIISDIPSKMFGVEFKISLERKGGTNESSDTAIIKTPSEDFFDDAPKFVFDLIREIKNEVQSIDNLIK